MFPPDDPGFWFWRVATILVLGACVVIIVSAAIGLAIGFVRGALDADVADHAPLSDLPSRSAVPDDHSRSSTAPLLRDVRQDFAWLAPPERKTNGSRPTRPTSHRNHG
jgi:hypothetical protein